MNKKWLIQSTGFNSSYISEIVETLNILNIEWVDFGIVGNKITNLDNILDDNEYIIRGGTRMLRILNNVKNLADIDKNLENKFYKNQDFYIQKLINGIDYDEKRFDMEYYSTLNLPLLNSEIELYSVDILLYSEFEQDMFIKPSKDSKAFNGGIINCDETLMNYLMRTPHLPIEEIKQEVVIIAPIQKIKEEYRFFMYQNTILGCSRYIINGEVNPNSFVPQDIKDKAKEYGDLYNPDEIYVMDLCTFQDNNDIKIVEYNCWNCSGFYHCDIKSIIKGINLIKN